MFTPPPSPGPYRTSATGPAPHESSTHEKEDHTQTEHAKQRTGRRLRLAVICVPLIVIILTLWAGYSTSRATQESFYRPPPLPWHAWIQDPLRRLHKRQPLPEPQSGPSLGSVKPTSTSAGATPSPSTTAIPNQPVPSVPSAPPVLPTPFPQPFDGGVAQNFSSLSCSSFFSNMTSATPFRSCRPFSLLLQTSAAFINAQTNLTLMNSIVWGTCNTNIPFEQCKSNMGWFASSLKTSCADELKQLNAMAVNTLLALQAYETMHDAGCLQDPTSNTYCYVNAVRGTNPADSYYYSLPLGLKLPKTAVPSCSSCSKSVMSLYSSALTDSSQSPQLTGLKSTYESAAALSAQHCGAQFAQSGLVSSATSFLSRSTSPWSLGIGVVFFTWLLVQIS